MMKKSLILLSSVSLFTGCFKGEKPVELTIKAKNHLGEPLASAQVFWDQELVGETDERGSFTVEREKKINAGSKIQVKKESSTHYFSEFNQNILIEDPQKKKDVVPLTLEATLFFVPKNNQEEVPPSSSKDPPLQADHNAQPSTKEIKSAANENPPLPESPQSPQEPTPETPPLVSEEEHDKDVKPSESDVLGNNADPGMVSPSEISSNSDQENLEVLSENLEPKTKIKYLSGDSKDVVRQELTRPKETNLPRVITVHLTEKKEGTRLPPQDQEHPSAQGLIRLYKKDSTTPLSTCTTNERGRCVLRIESPLEEPALLVASKDGFLTATTRVIIKPQSLSKLTLKAGVSLDLMTFHKIYDRHRSLGGITLQLNDKKIGQTNDFGFITAPWPKTKEALTTVILQDPTGQKILYQGDFVSPPKSTFIKFFAPEEDIRPRLGLLPPSIMVAESSANSDRISRSLELGVEEALFKSKIFTQYPSSLVVKRLKEKNLGPGEVQEEGFDLLDLGTTLDGMLWTELRPLNFAKDSKSYRGPWEIEMRLFDRRGRIIAGALREFDDFDPSSEEKDLSLALETLKHVGQNLAQILPLDFPFQGKITVDESNKPTQTITGTINPQTMKIFEKIKKRHLHIFGYQPSTQGNHETWTKVADGFLSSSEKDRAQIHIDWQAPRTIIQNGDLFQLSAFDTPNDEQDSAIALRIYAESIQKHRLLDRAHLYADGRWRGQSDEKGILITQDKSPEKVSEYRLSRAGYQSQMIYPKSFKKKTDEEGKILSPPFQRIELRPQMLLMSVDSYPQNASVFINGKPIGRTPLETFVNRDDLLTDIHMVLKLGSGYKDIRKSLGLPDQPIVLRGDKRLIFEQDFLAKGDRFVLSGRPRDAVAEFAKIPEEHSDYQTGQMRAAEVCLELLDDPEKSIEFFDKALASLPRQSFADTDVLKLNQIQVRIKRMMAFFKLNQTKKIHHESSDIKGYQSQLAQNKEDLAGLKNLGYAEKKELHQQNEFLEAWTYHLIALNRQDVVTAYQAKKKWRDFLRSTTGILGEKSLKSDVLLIDLKNKAEFLANQIAQGAPAALPPPNEKAAM